MHVVFKTHLDLGFTDLAAAVEERYRSQFIPRAIDLAEELAAEGGDDAFIWTTGSWLIDMSLRTGTPDQVARLERAIEAGHVAWHALTVTTHSELMDIDLFRSGIAIARRLDARFGTRTIAAKMTDVPGHTRGSVGLVADAGVEYVHPGVNPAPPRPHVPRAFRWIAPDGRHLVVNYADSYGSSSLIPGARDALEFAHTGDNTGPPTADEVRAVFADLRQKYPGATVVASTLDRYARAILAHADDLPAVSEEIGDCGSTAPPPIESRSLVSRWVGVFEASAGVHVEADLWILTKLAAWRRLSNRGSIQSSTGNRFRSYSGRSPALGFRFW